MGKYFNIQKLKLSMFIIMLFALVGILYIFLIHSGIVIPCVFHELTNFYCPGCGITRMFLSLLCLDFYQAFRFNALVFILLPFFVVFGVIQYKRWLFSQKYLKISNHIWNSILIITILFGILRNLDIFSFLAPTLI